MANLPTDVERMISDVAQLDERKSHVLRRYFSEMKSVISEMHRVLKRDKAAIMVIGNSVMRGKDIETHSCLSGIAKEIGFVVPWIGERSIDRNRRMLPAGSRSNANSQIQQRMHKEYILGLLKS